MCLRIFNAVTNVIKIMDVGKRTSQNILKMNMFELFRKKIFMIIILKIITFPNYHLVAFQSTLV